MMLALYLQTQYQVGPWVNERRRRTSLRCSRQRLSGGFIRACQSERSSSSCGDRDWLTWSSGGSGGNCSPEGCFLTDGPPFSPWAPVLNLSHFE